MGKPLTNTPFCPTSRTAVLYELKNSKRWNAQVAEHTSRDSDVQTLQLPPGEKTPLQRRRAITAQHASAARLRSTAQSIPDMQRSSFSSARPQQPPGGY